MKMKFSLAKVIKESPFYQIFKLNDDNSVISICTLFEDGPLMECCTIIDYVNLEDFKDAISEYSHQICPTCFLMFVDEYFSNDNKEILSKNLALKIRGTQVTNADYLIINSKYGGLLQMDEKALENYFDIPIIISDKVKNYMYQSKSTPFITDNKMHAEQLRNLGWTVIKKACDQTDIYHCTPY